MLAVRKPNIGKEVKGLDMFVLGTVFGVVFTFFLFKLEVTYGKVKIVRKDQDEDQDD